FVKAATRKNPSRGRIEKHTYPTTRRQHSVLKEKPESTAKEKKQRSVRGKRSTKPTARE
ncbi:Hypothetical predicted protein, partial [Pelobates cultripes]